MSDTATMKRKPAKAPFGSPYVFVLAVTEGDPAAVVHRLQCEESRIGRADEVEFTLDDPEVSKQHCSVRVSGSICTLHDLESLNGTFLNGRRMRPGSSQRLRHLDEIEIGATRLLFLGGRFKPKPPPNPSDGCSG